jgi:hypothetical protein
MQYGIFDHSSNCFLLSSNDLWITMHVSKLISSKIPVSVCDISNFQDINPNPENWTLINTSEINNNLKLFIIKEGIEKNIKIDENIVSAKDLADWVYKITKTSWLTDAYLNIANQNLYMTLLDEKSFSSFDEILGLEKGFLDSIDSILYQSSSIDEINEKIKIFFDNSYCLRPSLFKFYKKTFYDLLKNNV